MGSKCAHTLTGTASRNKRRRSRGEYSRCLKTEISVPGDSAMKKKMASLFRSNRRGQGQRSNNLVLGPFLAIRAT